MYAERHLVNARGSIFLRHSHANLNRDRHFDRLTFAFVDCPNCCCLIFERLCPVHPYRTVGIIVETTVIGSSSLS